MLQINLNVFNFVMIVKNSMKNGKIDFSAKYVNTVIQIKKKTISIVVFAQLATKDKRKIIYFAQENKNVYITQSRTLMYNLPNFFNWLNK